MPAKASAMRTHRRSDMPLSGAANADALPPPEVVTPSNAGTIAETLREKSGSTLPAVANEVGSTEAIRMPDTT